MTCIYTIESLFTSCSFDRKLVYSIARAISDEVRGKYNDAKKGTYPDGLVCWAPVVNVCRDRKCMSTLMGKYHYGPGLS